MRPYRKEKMASAIRDVVSETVAHGLHDPRVSLFTSITRVEMTGDLLIAKVYISVLGSEADESKTLAAMQHAAGHIQRQVANRLSIRHCPQLRFSIDESAKIARRTMDILEENRRRNPALYEDDESLDKTDQVDQPDEARSDGHEPRQPGGGGE